MNNYRSNSDLSNLGRRISTHHLLCGFASIHKTFGDNTWAQDFVSLSEFLEKNTIGKSLSADTDAFEYTIASQLIQNQVVVDLSSTFVVIGNDTSDKVRLGAIQRVHEASQLFLNEKW